MTTIKFLGGCREVGRTAVMLNSLILDYGIKPSDPPEFPLNGNQPSAVIISHAHLDHVGLAPNLMYYNPKVILTPPSHDLSTIILKDSMNVIQPPPFTARELRQFESNIEEVEYETAINVGGIEVEFFNAGHIPGSSSIVVRDSKSVLFSGDIKLDSTNLLEGAKVDYPEVDILIVESTYYGTEHPERKELEKAFVESILNTLDSGGHVIIPAFAVGRTQEVLMILEKYGISPYVDGLGKEVSEVILRYPDYIRSPKNLKKAIKNSIPVFWRMREEILEKPCVIVTTAGMLNGGPALFYISKLYNDEKSKILLTSYQVDGTNGDRALKYGTLNLGNKVVKLKMKVEQYDFSAHADDKQLKEYVKKVVDRGVEVVFTVHGEKTEEFAKWIRGEIGVEAYAPTNGEVYVV
ncbi:MAG: MBL fold metallo-hydrolase [Archaeoglobaceae archaeon]|nr:MBL fold metallo-hydrolase [Archaeoglobaceae archaeon]MCX8152340.1 MBL fold metallo-hydrolase [Archaeoglobaceae archaeon]MDW8013632.1 MBL fold metallo-hydrolase [Archaeoglobaceae archaeon]